MFESILNRILQQYLGNFISGLDPNKLKLAVWSGNLKLENVSVNPKIFDFFELPLKLKLNLNVWKNNINFKKISIGLALLKN